MASPRIVPTGVLGGIAGKSGKDGSNVLPTDTAIKQAIQDSTSQTAVALTAAFVGKSLTKGAGTVATLLREIADPSYTGTKWREYAYTGIFNGHADPVYVFGPNAGKAVGLGDAGQPSLHMGFEYDYYDTTTTRTMEWYVDVRRADASGPIFRPFAMTAARDGNTDLTASVQIDIGDGTHAVGSPDRSQFQIMSGATELAKWLPAQALLKTPIILTPPTGKQAAISLVTAASGDIGQIIFQDGGSAKWSIRKDHTTTPQLVIRDEANNGTIMRMFPGAAPKNRAVFIDAVACIPFSTTANRPNAGDFAAGGMWYDTTLGKPVWTNGSVWKDAAGTTV